MSFRGTLPSMTLAGLLASAPLWLPVLGYAIWAFHDLSHQAARIAHEERRVRDAAALTDNRGFYVALGEVWFEYAGSDASGLLQSPDARGGERLMIARAQEAVDAVDGVWLGAEALARSDTDGLQTLRIEFRAQIPEPKLAALVARLEQDQPYLFVDLLDLSRADSLDVIVTRLRLSAYRLLETQP